MTEDSILGLLIERDNLVDRLLQSLKHLDHKEQMNILASFISIKRLKEIVEFQESHDQG